MIKWTRHNETTFKDGWYWTWDGQSRQAIFVKEQKMYPNEMCCTPPYALSSIPPEIELWFTPCEPPKPPK